MGEIRGIDCNIYYNVSDYETPDWQPWDTVRDATFTLTFDEADGTSRGSGGFRETVPVLTSIEVTGTAIKDKDDTTHVAIEAAAVAKSTVDFVVLDGPIDSSSSDGWRFDGKLFNWGESQPYEDIVTIDFTIRPTRSDNSPTTFQGTDPV